MFSTVHALIGFPLEETSLQGFHTVSASWRGELIVNVIHLLHAIMNDNVFSQTLHIPLANV